MAVKPIPDGYHTVTPRLTVQGAPALIEFLKQAFDNHWGIATHIEDVAPEELEKRAAAAQNCS